MRDVVREEIDEAIKRLNFNNEQITEVGKNDWDGIIKNIENKFVGWKGHSSFWYWQFLKDGFLLFILIVMLIKTCRI